MKLTQTSGGLLLAVLGPIILHFLGAWGFSETCSNEVVQIVPAIAGGAMAWIHQVREGHITPLGAKV